MNSSSLVLATILVFLLSSASTAQHLPKGTFRPNRERTYDIIHFKTDLALDWQMKRVFGESTIRLRPLIAASSISLDAYSLTVTSVRALPQEKELTFTSTDSTLVIDFGRSLQLDDTVAIAIKHSAVPTAGLYFVDPPADSEGLSTVYTYGESGLHANWLPIYADPNDKFPTELLVTLMKPYQAISNGKLIEEKQNRDGTRTFHWLQKLPHSPYLIALFVGDYDSVQLAPAFGTIPLTCWVPRGRKEEGRYAFRNTTKMVEFFSNSLSYRYPWDKYDQVVAFDYAVGAMENTSVTGHRHSVLRDASAPDDFSPQSDTHESNWTAEATISHELAHHWFGDNLTCRSLASIWLNESFATYCMMLWDEHQGDDEFLQFKTWLALQSYLRYVSKEHIIRPMEYRRYDSREEIYNEEHTYLKGGLILHMLRWILGDEDFFGALSYFLHKHEFSNIESTDFKTAIEESTGRNLQWFFEQWIYGGGHPRFEVSYRYHADREMVEMTVQQTQPLVKGQGIFKLPVEVRIDTKSKTVLDTVWVENETDHFVFDLDEQPLMVSFDGRGKLVCELVFEKKADELIRQLHHDALPGRLRALHQLVRDYPANPQTLSALRAILNGDASWWLKAEMALQLQYIHTSDGERLLIDQLKASDYHVRKAAAIALSSHFSQAASTALRDAIESDEQADVAAAAIVSLAKIDPSLTPRFLRDLMSKPSWYDELHIVCLKAVEKIAAERFVPLIKENICSRFNMDVRQQALLAWAACAPSDPQFVDVLIASVRKEVLRVRQKAIELLGKLKPQRAGPVLEELSRKDGDGDIRHAAKKALEGMRRVTGKN